MNQQQNPTIQRQRVVDSIFESLCQTACDGGRRYDVGMIYPCEADKGDKKAVLHGDLLKMPFKENSFHRISTWNLAAGYEPNLVDLYTKFFNLLRPGSMFASYEWVTTESYQGDNPKHVEIINGIKTTLGLPGLRSSNDVSKVAEKVGFEVVEEKGNFVNSLVLEEWLKKKRSGYRRMYKAIKVLEKLGLMPKSTVDDRKMWLKAVEYLIKGSETGIFSPLHMTLCRKPGEPPKIDPRRHLAIMEVSIGT